MTRQFSIAEHERHVCHVLPRRVDCLLTERPWLSPGFNLLALTPAERATMASEAISLAAERQAMLFVLSDIRPIPSSGVERLAASLEAMGTRLSKVTEAASEDVRACVRSRSEAEGDGPRRAVLENPQLLASIISFMERGHWLYLTPVAHCWRTAYMAATARRQGVQWVCTTSGSAAVETPERLAKALVCGINVTALTRSSSVHKAAGASGSLEVVRRLHNLGMPVSRETFLGAARARRMHLLYKLPALTRKSGVQVTFGTVMFIEAHILCDVFGHEQQKEALIWLSQQVQPWPVWYCTHLCYIAAENGQLSSLQFLMHKDHGQVLFGPLMQDFSAVELGAPEWFGALDYDERWSGFVKDVHLRFTLMDKAASGGHVEVLQWLSQQRELPFTPQTMTCAAKCGRLSALQWLCQAGCPYDIADLCSVSLDNAFLELLVSPMQMEWLRSLGGSWSRKMVTDALFNLVGCPSAQEMVVWLRSEGAEWPRLADVGTLEYNIADAQAVLWAAQQGCPWGHWTPRCCAIVSRGRYSIKKMLHDAGCPCKCV
eukprot:TRINITY_DN2806_c0_g3_i1.p1 TRINITY_DN2806_c0_g3~~TRINITY_DN2806_c0_g3_i1.p1  ORF type:complete len:545 (+),score=77.24 TRINITY_DN2806_c0_g3_i1:82-1716(+)